MNKLSAVLLDLDGTLIDSLPALRATYDRFLTAHGRVGSDEEFARWCGPPLTEVVSGLASAHGLETPGAELLGLYLKLLDEAYVNEVTLVPGGSALLDTLVQANISLALVTSSPTRMAEAILRRLKVRGYFTLIVGGDDLGHGKPAPDPYLHAIKRLGVAVDRAIAIEDSITGVRSAAGAGLRCIAVSAARPLPRLREGATVVVRDLVAAHGVLNALIVGRGRVVPTEEVAVRFGGERLHCDDRQLSDRIDTIWVHAARKNPRLRDHTILSVLTWSVSAKAIAMEVAATPYRYFISRVQGCDVGARPLGINGIVRYDLPGDPIVLGRRAATVTQFVGHWEFAPAGSVPLDRAASDGEVDLERQLLEELEEELGIERSRVLRTLPLGLVEDLEAGVVDICFLVEVRHRGGREEEERRLRESIRVQGEYDDVALIARAALPDFSAAHPVTPAVKSLLALLDQR